MPHRGYVLIFFLWALISIITPTLVFFSASAKPNMDSKGDARIEMKVRRMMASLDKDHGRNATSTQAPAPALAPPPVRGDAKHS